MYWHCSYFMQNFLYILLILLTETSHRKLLLQMEEEVNTQLNDAERRITAIHEASFCAAFIIYKIMTVFLTVLGIM